MLAWIHTQIPEQKIKNFTTDWNDGVALCALVNRVQPGLIPHFATLSRSNKLENCSLGMKVAESKLEIPYLMDPEDLSHPNIDELSVMTYISYFTTAANSHLLRYIQATIPSRNITNFSTDWNDGINLACLLNALNPGGFSDWSSLDPQKALDNLTRGMKAAKDQLGIEPVLKPSEMTDPKVDELNIVTYLSRFKNAKALPQPTAITCSGEGLSKAVAGKLANFQVDTSKGGSGSLEVTINLSSKPVTAEMKDKGKGIFAVSYQPQSGGKVSISIKWSGTEIPTSPYQFHVIDPSSFSLSSTKLSGKEFAKVGEVVTMELKGFTKASEAEVKVQTSSGTSENAKIVETSAGVAKCSYTPRKAGTDKVTATIAGMQVPGSPFSINVIDPSVLEVSLKKPPLNEPLQVNQEAMFLISAKVGGVHDVKAEVTTPKGTHEVPLSSSGNSSTGSVKPTISGSHKIRVTCGGSEIKGSPISLSVYDPSKFSFKDSLPKFLHVGKPYTVSISAEGAGKGTMDAATSEQSILTAKLEKKSDKSFSIALNPKKAGDASVSLKWNGKDLPQCPHKVSVCDTNKCSAFGPGLTSGKGKVNELFEFTVQVKGGGNGELSVIPKGPKTVYGAKISKASNETYNVSFTTFELGVHSIGITWSGEDIPNSPYSVNFVKAAPASAFTVTGEGIKTAIAQAPANLMIMGPESGLLSNETLKISISGMNLSSQIVNSKGAFKISPNKVMVYATDKDNGAYPVEFIVPKPGNYSISITSNDENVPGSPFKLNVLPPPSAEDCVAFGYAIDNPHSLVLSKPVEFKVDSTNAGTGELAVTAEDKNSKPVPVFLAEDKSKAKKRIHAVKIDTTTQGLLKIRVQWSGKDIPKSPFSFEINDPKAVIVLDLPDSSDYVGRKGDEFSFSVDTRPAGSKGELKAAAKFQNGKVEPFRVHQNSDGTTKLLFTPAIEGRMELLLTLCGVSILTTPWQCDITDPKAFKLTIPKGPSKKGDQVKFIISGLTAKTSKNIVATAKNKTHEPPIKMSFEQTGQATATFLATEIGEYEVLVKAAKKHITGSPFKCVVVDPDACVVKGDIPPILIVGVEKTFSVDTAKAGPGSLTFDCTGRDGGASNAILSKMSGVGTKSVELEGTACGNYSCSLKFADFPIPGMPRDITCTDPTKCSFTCTGVSDGRCNTNNNVSISIDTTLGGCCAPQINAFGPKSKYDVKLKTVSNGKFTAEVTPWQEGSNTIEVSVGGKRLNGSPIKFQSLKPIDPNKITISGSGLSKAVVNRRAQVTIHARESKLLDQGVLKVAFGDKGNAAYDVDVIDKLNGSYELSFVPNTSGSLSFSVTGEGREIPGSPFNVTVLPEPDHTKCKVKDRSGSEMFKDSPEIYHLIRTPFEVGVHMSEAGSGSLTATGKGSNGSKLQLFTSDAKEGGAEVKYVKFDPTSVGTYSLDLRWDGKELIGSPFKIKVVDPSRCAFKTAFPSLIRLGDDTSYEVDTRSAGDGDVEAYSMGPEVSSSVVKESNGKFIVVLSGAKLGSTSVDLKFGGYSISSSPYTLSVCDPSKCVLDFEARVCNVDKPFAFKVLAKGAGTAKLKVTSSKKHSYSISNRYNSTWEVSFTPKEIGEHMINIFWGEWEVSGSPITVNVCDPNLVQISGLPDPSEILMIDVPVTFFLDHSRAGAGAIACQMKYSDGNEVDVEREETDGGADKSSFTFVPQKPGKMTIILEYNNVSVLPKLYEYSVPDPSNFSVTPFKGYGKIKEYVKFAITGVKDESQIKISAHHPDHTATVKTEQNPGDSTLIARFTPKKMGDYTVEVTLADQHIEGSPFTVQVANPDAVELIGKLDTVVHVGGEPNFKVDVSKAGPGELSFENEVISGTAQDPSERSGDSWLVPLKEGVGKVKVFVKWAGYDIRGSPFIFSYVDSQKVTWSCEALESGEVLKQGQLIKVILDCSAAGDASPVVTAKGPEGEYPTSTTDNEDGTFEVTITPWQIGKNEAEVKWGGKPTAKAIAFEVMKNIEARGITASGDGLTKAIANTLCSLTINGIDSGLVERGLLKAHFESDEEDRDPSVEITDEGRGTYSLSFTPTCPQVHTLVIKYDDQDILNSPFSIPVLPAPNATLCKTSGDAIEKDPPVFVANNPVKFEVDTSEAGTGTLTVAALQPNGEPIRVYAMEEGGLHHLKFDPVIIGSYTMEVQWDGANIPGSPFTFNVVDPSKCKVTGIPAESSPIQASETFNFLVDTREVGDCAACLAVSSQGATITLLPASKPKPSDDTTDNATPSDNIAASDGVKEGAGISDGLYNYKFDTSVVGKATLNVKIADVHVSGSPFSLTVVDSGQFSIAGLNIEGEYAIVCEPVEITVDGKPAEDDEDEDLIVVAHGPTADLNVDVTEKKGVGYLASFVPIEPGSYEVFVEFARRHVRGSPFTIKVADPSKCQILGNSPSVLHIGSSEEMTVKTRGAGEGVLTALVEDGNEIISIEVKDLGLDTYSVVFTGNAIGIASANLQWGGYNIPKCPLPLSVCDASKCKAVGEIFNTKRGKAGSLISFMVETEGAGEANLEVSAKGPSAQYTVNVVEKEGRKYEVSFTPWEIGEHTINMLWGKVNIAESPFTAIVGSPLEMEVCNATGDGLKHAIAGRKTNFTILSSEVGLLDKNALSVSVMGISAHADLTVVDNNNGTYKVEYVAPSPGAYVATILFHGQNIPGSPFKITVAPGPDASKCKVYGPALHPNALAIAGSPLEFFVDTAEAGKGELKVYIQGPNDYRPKVFLADDDQGVHSIKFDAMKAGKYFAVIVWSEQHIPKSPLKLRVHPAADAGRVRAFGPGLINGFIGAPGQFTIETKNAGIGTLLIRVHGLKDSFKIEAHPLSEDDPRTLITTYNPRLVGEYTVFVRWSGVHVPGSPFTVQIRQKPGMSVCSI